jgi:putative CocE/NonD family hydrolase
MLTRSSLPRLSRRPVSTGVVAALLTSGIILQAGGTNPDQKSPVVVGKSGVKCHTEYVAMRDGVLLATDVYLPAAPGKYPVILQRTPYGLRLGHGCFERTSGQMAYWAEHGYVGITQDARGTFRSQGNFQPIVQEQADGHDAVEWAAAQAWSNGRVGMAGTSYFGVTQWQAALARPPHLLAIAPGQTATDYHDHWTYVNGVFDLWFGQSWLLNFFTPDEFRRREIAKGQSPENALKASDEYLSKGKEEIFSKWSSQAPLTAFDGFRTLAPYYYEWLAHPNYDEYWAKVDVEAHFSDLKVPAFISGGWSDLFALGSVRGFMGLRAHGGTPEARAGTKLIMQPGGHGGEGVIEYGRSSDVDVRSMQLRFYDRYVKGTLTEPDRDPAVQLFVQVPPDNGTQGRGFWLTSDTFPLPATQKTRYNLRSGGKANSRRGDGLLDASAPSDGPDDTFVYDPKRPVPSYGGGLCCLSLGSYFGSGAQDQSVIELRDDVLVYTSAPLAKDLAAIGPVTVSFWARSTAKDTDFTAKVVDVHPDGFAQNVLDRIVRARFREGSKKAPSLIEPGKVYQYTIDLGYAGTVFKRGHRIRLDISSSSFPHFAPNHNTGGDPANDSQFVTATQTLVHNPQQPAFVELSVVPDVALLDR